MFGVKMTIKTDYEICENATPGPWKYDYGNWEVESINKEHYRASICENHSTCSNQDRQSHYDQFELIVKPIDSQIDMLFIAHFNPTKIKQMLDKINKLEDIIRTPCNKCDKIYIQMSKEIESLDNEMRSYQVRIAELEEIELKHREGSANLYRDRMEVQSQLDRAIDALKKCGGLSKEAREFLGSMKKEK